MKCIHCDHQIVIPWNKRDSVRQKHKSRHDSDVVHASGMGKSSTQFVLPSQFIMDDGRGCFRLSIETEKPVLYVYDLFSCLKHGYVNNLSIFQKIYDVKTLEKLHYLGMYHPRYRQGHSKTYGLIKRLEEVSSQEMLDDFGPKVWGYLDNLVQTTGKNQVLNHYEQVELPFTLALFTLAGEGFDIDRASLAHLTSDIEIARNRLVEPLREKGIDTPTRESLREWLPYSDSEIDASMLMNLVDHIDFKTIRDVDPVFDTFYRIEKLERIGDCVKGVSGFTGPIVPDYQIVGTNTLRCTSKRPNLLGFPKQLRPVVKAGYGRCIVECDYAQMEVGISAALAEDELLTSDYNSGDVYSALGVELSIDRDTAKLVFLAILYGVSHKTLQVWLQKSEENVRQIFRALFTRYSGLERYQSELVRQGQSMDYVESVSGVRRLVNKKRASNAVSPEAIRAWESNWFKNYPVQASAATVFKQAIIEVAENVEPREFKLIAPLYDAIVFEAPLVKKDFYTDLVSSAMKRAMTRYFPVLDPQVTVNDHDISCWNGGEGVTGLEEILR